MPKGVAKNGKRICFPRVDRIQVACKYCGMSRRVTPGYLRNREKYGKGFQYCSRRCMGLDRRQLFPIECFECRSQFQPACRTRRFCCSVEVAMLEKALKLLITEQRSTKNCCTRFTTSRSTRCPHEALTPSPPHARRSLGLSGNSC